MSAIAAAPRVAALDDSTTSFERSAPKPPALLASLGFGSPYRSFAYSDIVTSSLGDYQLSGAPMVDLALSYYPGRHLTEGPAAWFGIDVATQIALKADTVDRDGAKFESKYRAYRAGVRARVPLAAHALHVFSGYAVNQLEVTSETPGVPAPTPELDYRMVRSGLGAELAITTALRLVVDAAWLHMLSLGGIEDWFPRARARGLELAVGALYALSDQFFARISATYQRTAFDFNSRPGDERSAGGVTDQGIVMAIGAGVRL